MVGEHIAMSAALYYRLLRRKGVTVHGIIDLLIATFCIVNGHRLSAKVCCWVNTSHWNAGLAM